MIKEKTTGNLSKVETEYLEKVLFELHMNFVDEADKDAKEGKDVEKPGEDSGGEKTAGSDAEESPPEKDGGGAVGSDSEAASDEKEV
jgi:hypothetical protein